MNRRERVYQLINQARKRQDGKWYNEHTRERWATILMAQSGQVARAVLNEEHRDYKRELVQLAATAVAALEDEVSDE